MRGVPALRVVACHLRDVVRGGDRVPAYPRRTSSTENAPSSTQGDASRAKKPSRRSKHQVAGRESCLARLITNRTALSSFRRCEGEALVLAHRVPRPLLGHFGKPL